MKQKDFIASSEIAISKSADKVWNVLTDTELAKEYMFGATVTTSWKEGDNITWAGEWKGKKFEDKGKILKVIPNSLLQYTHYSPLSGAEDLLENYHTVTISLEALGGNTRVSLTQDGNETEEEMLHSQQNWDTMLKKLKQLVEGS